MTVDMRVEDLVLDGMSPLQARALQDALRQQLARVMGTRAWPANLRRVEVSPVCVRLSPPFNAERAAAAVVRQLVDALEDGR